LKPDAIETQPLGSTMTPSQVRKLKIAIAIMSVLLVAGFILLLVGIYLQTQKLAQQPKGATRETPQGIFGMIDIPVRAGSELRQIVVDQGSMILHLRHPGGDELAVIDMATGREIQRFKLEAQKSP
jgi:uncharacterized membrane protein